MTDNKKNIVLRVEPEFHREVRLYCWVNKKRPRAEKEKIGVYKLWHKRKLRVLLINAHLP